MRLLYLSLFLLWAFAVNAQKDSSAYFLNQLKKSSLTDSTRSHYYLKLADIFIYTRPDRSILYSRQGYSLALKINNSPLLFISTHQIGRIFNETGDRDSGLVYAKLSYKYAQANNSLEEMYRSLNLLGHSYLLNNKMSDAKANLDKAFEIVNSQSDIPHKCHVYVNMSNYYYKILKPDKSIELLKQAELLAKNENDTEDLMNVYAALGGSYSRKGKIDSAQFYYLQPLEYFSKKGRIRREALIYEELAKAYSRLYNTAKLNEYTDLAHAKYKKYGDLNSANNVLLVKALSYFQTMNFDKTIEVINIVEPNAVKLNNRSTLAICHLFRAGAFGIVGDTVSANEYQQSAEKIGREVEIPAFSDMNKMIKMLAQMGKSKFSGNDSLTQKTFAALKKQVPGDLAEGVLQSLTLNKDFLQKNKTDFINTYENLKANDSVNATEAFSDLINQPLDSNVNAMTNKQLLELETKYKTKQKDDSISLQTQLIGVRDQSIKTRNNFLIILGLLAIVITGLFIQSLRQSKKIRRQFFEIEQLQSELRHRTGNFFNSISGMMSIASATTSDKETLSDLTKRVNTINRLYTTLYSSAGKSETSFSDLLSSICNDFENTFSKENKFKIYNQCNVAVSNDEAVPLAYIITELLTNAEKYAFRQEKGGEIHVDLGNENENRYLHVWDNGKGIGTGVTPRTGSQGMSIIKSYAKNLEGKITTWSENGFHFKLDF